MTTEAVTKIFSTIMQNLHCSVLTYVQVPAMSNAPFAHAAPKERQSKAWSVHHRSQFVQKAPSILPTKSCYIYKKPVAVHVWYLVVI